MLRSDVINSEIGTLPRKLSVTWTLKVKADKIFQDRTSIDTCYQTSAELV